MINADNVEATRMPMSKCISPAPRTNSDAICELSAERSEVSRRLGKLKMAIEANPEFVSEHHKQLWRRQADAIQAYVDVLGERIKDLIDNDKE